MKIEFGLFTITAMQGTCPMGFFIDVEGKWVERIFKREFDGIKTEDILKTVKKITDDRADVYGSEDLRWQFVISKNSSMLKLISIQGVDACILPDLKNPQQIDWLINFHNYLCDLLKQDNLKVEEKQISKQLEK
ncbi:MAG: hypothetical protein ABH829_05285 [archaeon]